MTTIIGSNEALPLCIETEVDSLSRPVVSCPTSTAIILINDKAGETTPTGGQRSRSLGY
jgi:hypothetical protein